MLIYFRFGRKYTIIACMIILCLSSFGAAFSPAFEVFIALRFLIAASAAATFTTGYVYCKFVYILLDPGAISRVFFPFRSGNCRWRLEDLVRNRNDVSMGGRL